MELARIVRQPAMDPYVFDRDSVPTDGIDRLAREPHPQVSCGIRKSNGWDPISAIELAEKQLARTMASKEVSRVAIRRNEEIQRDLCFDPVEGVAEKEPFAVRYLRLSHVSRRSSICSLVGDGGN